jgi:hypothetical protein
VNPFYKLGALAALRKIAGERVDVIRDGEEDHETYQRQAQDRRTLQPSGKADAAELWDQFDQRIQNPAEVAFHSRFVSP